ncbi:MAG: 6-carboxytetrahydropterin synthase QueD [Syntrophomonadaceae bacterium]|nr:6-carboxytetrahydropterin synthase QueD [Syntrophomonadaceae bacterium]MDD3023009.1 6-carboxytetrahydropterin synthase QueD [Syntrophomonadaceae bacterium]
MGFAVSLVQEFAAAHWLKNYQGNCKNIHGHTWKVEVVISGEQLDEAGMLVDFREIKATLAAVLEKYDHTLLNEVRPFDTINPTAENIACYIYHEIKKAFPKHKIVEVKVWESSIAWASYNEV